jgi:hypothetical protein
MTSARFWFAVLGLVILIGLAFDVWIRVFPSRQPEAPNSSPGGIRDPNAEASSRPALQPGTHLEGTNPVDRTPEDGDETRRRRLTVRVLGPDGNRVRDVSLGLYAVSNGHERHVPCLTEPEENGDCVLVAADRSCADDCDWPADLPMRLDVYSRHHGRLSADVDVGQALVVARYPESSSRVEEGSLEVTFADFVPMHGTRMWVGILPSGEDFTARRGWTEAVVPTRGANSGKVLFDHVRCDEYELHVLESMQVIDTEKVTIHPGKNEVTLAVPEILAKTFTVNLRVPDGQEGDNMVLFLGVNRLSREQKLDHNLCARIERLPIGDYVFAHLPPSESPGEYGPVHVDGNEDVTFLPQPMNSLRASILNSTGCLAKAGFRDGDVITAINGEPFSDYSSLHKAYYHDSLGDGRIHYTIQRGGSAIEIVLSKEEVAAPSSWGGLMQPSMR